MKINVLRKKPESELRTMINDHKERLQKLRFDLVSGKIKNIREIREIKKDIARILTILKNEKSGPGSKKEAVQPEVLIGQDKIKKEKTKI